MGIIRKIIFVLFIVFVQLINGAGLHAHKIDSLLNGMMLESKVHYGVVMPHNEEISYLLTDNISGAEITLSTHSTGRHLWEALYRFPVYGIGYNYNNFHSPNVFGKAHAIFGFF